MNLERALCLAVLLPFIESAHYAGRRVMPNRRASNSSSRKRPSRDRTNRVNRIGPEIVSGPVQLPGCRRYGQMITEETYSVLESLCERREFHIDSIWFNDPCAQKTPNGCQVMMIDVCRLKTVNRLYKSAPITCRQQLRSSLPS